MLDELEKVAKAEGYMTDSAKVSFDSLRTLLKHDLDKDLDTHRASISEYLSSEIVSRYYNQRGEIEQSLRHDIAIDSAATVLNDPARYSAILSPAHPYKTKK
jgi:carboxyl-terminal processing protease